MKRSGWNPIRRNRNIGTSKQGYGKDNKLVIPDRWSDLSIYWERLNNPVAIPITVNKHKIDILVEPTTHGYFHACTVEDIEFLLQKIPVKHLQEVKLIVLRQPKKKEQILCSVWGRMAYWANIGEFSGPAIYLEAQPLDVKLTWSKKLSVQQKAELERLKQDGHKISEDKRSFYISTCLQSIRNTQLYRTLPHEVGHLVDYLVHVTEASAQNPQQKDLLLKMYWSKPKYDKEIFAHRYADEFYQKNNVAFCRIENPKRMMSCGLNPKWFIPRYESKLL